MCNATAPQHRQRGLACAYSLWCALHRGGGACYSAWGAPCSGGLAPIPCSVPCPGGLAPIPNWVCPAQGGSHLFCMGCALLRGACAFPMGCPGTPASPAAEVSVGKVASATAHPWQSKSPSSSPSLVAKSKSLRRLRQATSVARLPAGKVVVLAPVNWTRPIARLPQMLLGLEGHCWCWHCCSCCHF